MSIITNHDLEEIKDKIVEVLEIPMEVEDFNGDIVPSVLDLDDSNEGLLVECAILFVDIRGSSTLSDTSWAKSMAKIYRAFVRAMVLCVYKSGGRVRQIVGDRVMGVFVNDSEIKATQKALNAARGIVTIIDYYFNPECRKKVNGKEIQCGIGIDYGKVLLTQVGIKAQDEEAKDLVWAGKIANVASKHTDLAEPGEIFITKRFHEGLPINLKADEKEWEAITRIKGNSLFEGFAKQNFYLDCVSDEAANESVKKDFISTESFKHSTDGISINEIVTSIVQGTQKQTEQLLQRFETVVKREVALEEKENVLSNFSDELKSKEHRLLQKEQKLDSLQLSIDNKVEFKKNEVEFELRAKFLSENMKMFEFEKVLDEIKYLVNLGEKIEKSHLKLKRNYLYYWRLVPYIKNYNLNFAYKLIEEYLDNFAIVYGGIPFDIDIIDIVKKTNKESEFLHLVKVNLQKYPPEAEGFLIIQKVIKALGFHENLDYYAQKLVE